MLKAGFFSLTHTGLEADLFAGRPHRGMECRQNLWRSMSVSSSGDAWKSARSSWACTKSPQSFGGPRAGETG
jgi:hypothetical protein